MDNFDSLKNIWQQDVSKNPVPPPPPSAESKHAKFKMQKQYVIGSILLVLTGLLILVMAVFLDFGFKQWYTFGAMGLITLICFAQATFLYRNYLKMKQINDSALPSDHLKQWKSYYQFRKKQNKWNGPLYFIALNFALGIYFIEIFTGRPMINVVILLSVYSAWMAYAYFVLGRKVLKKEEARLKTILDELEGLANQFEK